MSRPEPNITVNVDVTNPGQFFACCGLLELADRLWPGAEGWFEERGALFHIRNSEDQSGTFACLIEKLIGSELEGELSAEEADELDKLQSRKKSEGDQFPKSDEDRRKTLDKKRREGAITFAPPMNLRLAWWQEADGVPKTFAGQQNVLRMAKAMLPHLSDAIQQDRPFDYRCHLEATNNKVEPFYFDARRFTHALDVGFSLDVQEQTIRATAAPITELLALIGLQRFRPRLVENSTTHEYVFWRQPLPALVASAIVVGAVPYGVKNKLQFRRIPRAGGKEYKAFTFATPIGDQS